MKKFPVVSENGATYEVKIERVRYCWAVRVRVKGRWFMRTLYRNLYWGHRNDFVNMAKDTVADYESSISDRLLHGIQTAENRRKFEEWDGDCR